MQLNETLEEMRKMLDAIPVKEFKEKPMGYDKR